MLVAKAAAAAINHRLSPEVKSHLAKHSGRHIALSLPGRRFVFGIDARGELTAASPLIQADAEITPFADNGNGGNKGGGDASDNIQIAGDAKLLSALQAAWQECADIQGGIAKITGDPLAADITSAAKTLAAECKTALTAHFITEEELKTFTTKTRNQTTRN